MNRNGLASRPGIAEDSGGSRPRARTAVLGICLTVGLTLASVATVPAASAIVQAPATPSAALLSGQAAGDGHYLAEIRRTGYGIPHILADNYGSLGYGYGYAFAQDNLCILADRIATVRGERSEFFGPSAESDDPLAPATNLDSDIYYQSIRNSGIVQRLLARPAPLGPTRQVRQLVDGYVAGYNHYLADTGVANLPDPTCRGQAWVTPISASDMWQNIYDINQLSGITSFKDAIASAAPPAAAGPASAARPAAPAVPALPHLGTASIGSNGWAIGRESTTGHDGMLLANPHFPWDGYGRFYEVQLTIPGVLNVSGASLDGTPVVEIGHTDGLAWTHTVSTAQRFTLYQLTLVPGDPTSYLVDGHAVAMTRQTVTVTVRGSGGLSRVTRTLYFSRYGPVLADGWSTTAALAVDGASTQNLRSINEWLAMDKSENLTQLRTAQDTYQGIPFTYTIATDSSGTSYIADASVVPHVTDAEAARCIDTPEGQAAYPGLFILDGSTSTCAWGSDPDAIQPGIFGPGHDPSLTRADYAANSNDTIWLSNPAAPLTGYPAIFGPAGTEPALRPQLSHNMIAERLAGTDGYGPPGFTLATLQQTTLGDRNHSAELGLGGVVAMCRAHPVLTASNGADVDVSGACAVLAAWDAHANSGSQGEILWRQFFADLATSAAPDSWWVVPFNPAQPLTTPNGFNGSDPDVQTALADAVQFFQENHIPLGITPGDVVHYSGIALHGCTDFEGCFATVEPGSPFLDASGNYPDVVDGSSFIMAVELTRDGPQARMILTYSESANPDSPHYTDQTKLFARKQWVTERFTQAQITADPMLQTTVLRG